MDERKCECGHTNPVGTLLCESCGKPLDEGAKDPTSFPDMRYEGMARRSQTHSHTLIDRVWNFFSSVKVAIWLILVTLVASAVGTLLPQERYIPVPVNSESEIDAFYAQTYGTLGKLYYTLGFHNLYSSWWYVTLLVMIGTSLVICSLDRIIPLYKALNKPRINPHLSFLKGQKLYGESEAGASFEVEETLAKAEETLKKRGYRVYRQGHSLLGEKARFSRWGPYVNHIGLILFLVAVLMRNIPGFYLEEYVWVRDGQTVPVPETPFYVKNLAYKTEYYAENEFPEKLDLNGGVVPKNYQTDAVLYQNENAGLPGSEPRLKEVWRGSITVNHPMKYKDLLLYQSGKQENQLGALNFTLIDRKNGNKPVGTIKLDVYNPAKEQTVADGVVVRVLDYFPDFYLDKTGGTAVPATKSNAPNNPMFALAVDSKKDGTSEKLVYLSGGIITQSTDPRYVLTIERPDLINISGLMVRKDKMLPLIYFGCFVTMVGLVMGFYWQHRRIWVHAEQNRLYLAGHTNKNWFGLRREMEVLRDTLGVPLELVQATKPGTAAVGRANQAEAK